MVTSPGRFITPASHTPRAASRNLLITIATKNHSTDGLGATDNNSGRNGNATGSKIIVMTIIRNM